MWIEYDRDPKSGATIYLSHLDGDFIRIDRGINWRSVAKATLGDSIPPGSPIITLPEVKPGISVERARILREGLARACVVANWMDKGGTLSSRPIELRKYDKKTA